jgi:ABC-2 type transport system permease protein
MLIIAGREYMSYVRTAGFWLSLIMAPLGLVIGAGMPILMDRAEQGSRIAIVDVTGRDYAARVQTQFGEDQEAGAIQAMRVAATTTAGEDAGSPDPRSRPHRRGGRRSRRVRTRGAPCGPQLP